LQSCNLITIIIDFVSDDPEIFHFMKAVVDEAKEKLQCLLPETLADDLASFSIILKTDFYVLILIFFEISLKLKLKMKIIIKIVQLHRRNFCQLQTTEVFGSSNKEESPPSCQSLNLTSKQRHGPILKPQCNPK
jgi:hypothetical protein